MFDLLGLLLKALALAIGCTGLLALCALTWPLLLAWWASEQQPDRHRGLSAVALVAQLVWLFIVGKLWLLWL